MRLLDDVAPDFVFRLHDGRVLKSLKELFESLKSMPDKVFFHHVNEERNDFANWIRDVFKDDRFANRLFSAKDKRSFSQVIARRISQFQIHEIANGGLRNKLVSARESTVSSIKDIASGKSVKTDVSVNKILKSSSIMDIASGKTIPIKKPVVKVIPKKVNPVPKIIPKIVPKIVPKQIKKVPDKVKKIKKVVKRQKKAKSPRKVSKKVPKKKKLPKKVVKKPVKKVIKKLKVRQCKKKPSVMIIDIPPTLDKSWYETFHSDVKDFFKKDTLKVLSDDIKKLLKK